MIIVASVSLTTLGLALSAVYAITTTRGNPPAPVPVRARAAGVARSRRL